jgi:hypothetical protein
MNEKELNLLNVYMAKFESFARKDGLTADRVKAYAFTQATKLVAILQQSQYPRGLNIRQAIVAGIL